MKLYRVMDGDEIEQYFVSLTEAVRFAKRTDREHFEALVEHARQNDMRPPSRGDWTCMIDRIETLPLTRELVLRVLNDEAYLVRQERVWPREVAP